VQRIQKKWSLTVGAPFPDATCAWVAVADLPGGPSAVLKIPLPHMEAADEADGLRFWNGEPTVQLLDFDRESGAMLVERCRPGMPLHALPESEQDEVIAGLLRRSWRRPVMPHPFRPLSAMIESWCAETRADENRWADAGLVHAGLTSFDELLSSAGSSDAVLLMTDLHAGNVLQAEREPWLVIDPKPFIGDRAYDATQHLLNCRERLRTDPNGTITRLSDLLGVDPERVRLWTFARAAAEPRDDWNGDLTSLARLLAP